MIHMEVCLHRNNNRYRENSNSIRNSDSAKKCNINSDSNNDTNSVRAAVLVMVMETRVKKTSHNDGIIATTTVRITIFQSAPRADRQMIADRSTI